MKNTKFNDSERRLISRLLHREPRKIEGVFAYAVYLLPSVLFAAYSVWNKDFVAALVAYLALLVVAIMYLQYTRTDAYALYSAIKKYEAKVGALRDSEET